MKAKYLLPCSCGRQIPVEPRQAGQQIACPCGAQLEVPAMRGLAQLERATPETVARQSSSAEQPRGASEGARTPAKAPARPTTPVWGTRQKLLLIGALIAVLGLGIAGFQYSFRRPRIIDAEVMSPIQSWWLWHDLRHGIDQRADWEAFYLASLATYRRWMIVATFVAGVGVLVMASSLLAPSRGRGRRMQRPRPNVRARGRTRAI